MADDIRIAQVCEPLFLYLCELNRLRREGITENAMAVRFGAVRHQVELLLSTCATAANASNHLREQWMAIERPLYCFLDSMIEEIFGGRNGEAPMPCAVEWSDRRLAEEKFNIVAGDDAFYDFLHKALGQRDTEPGARELLEFYHACLMLGFSGKYRDDPELDEYRQRVAGRVQHLFKKGIEDRFTPEAYEHLNQTNLPFEPEPALWGVAIVTVVIVIFFFVATAWLYKDASQNLSRALEAINHSNN